MYLYTLVYQPVLVCKTIINHINIGLMFTNLSPICAYPLVITVVSHDQSLSMVFHGGTPNKPTLIKLLWLQFASLSWYIFPCLGTPQTITQPRWEQILCDDGGLRRGPHHRVAVVAVPAILIAAPHRRGHGCGHGGPGGFPERGRRLSGWAQKEAAKNVGKPEVKKNMW